VGKRALVVGAEHVGFSAVLMLAHAGVRVVGMTTELPRHQSFALARAATAVRYRFPLWTRTAVNAIRGRPRVEEVALLDLESGTERTIECDTVVFSGDWIPDHELAAAAGLELDRGTRGPAVDTGLRTARPGVFAAGNLLHAAEPADVAALGGRRAAASVVTWLEAGDWPRKTVPLVCRPPLRWISPTAVGETKEEPPRDRFLLRARTFLGRSGVEIRQDGRLLWTGRARRLTPGRSTSLSGSWLHAVDPDRGPIEVAVADG
jgi:pyruvate/2-oxoglutarate dehydrogenase complex dihydrolipoamide dehydrogenase (E3) component